eukprot:3893579-Amphidinium_carterae.1
MEVPSSVSKQVVWLVGPLAILQPELIPCQSSRTSQSSSPANLQGPARAHPLAILKDQPELIPWQFSRTSQSSSLRNLQGPARAHPLAIFKDDVRLYHPTVFDSNRDPKFRLHTRFVPTF